MDSQPQRFDKSIQIHLMILVANLCHVSCMHLAGNLWANDENKFGHKLMEKMGWEKGKGLGANQVNCRKIRYTVKKSQVH